MRSRRYYERQIDKLLTVIAAQNDRIMHLSGHTWTAPPPSEPKPDPEPRTSTTSPEQWPDGGLED